MGNAFTPSVHVHEAECLSGYHFMLGLSCFAAYIPLPFKTDNYLNCDSEGVGRVMDNVAPAMAARAPLVSSWLVLM